MFERIFKLKENSTTISTEVIAGVTTFMTMAYIIFVQPQILHAAGMDMGSVLMATCIASAIACLIMGFVANYPIGLAPGMGENFFFAYTVVLGMGVPWQTALGMVFVSGVIFMLLSIFKVRELVVNAVPDCLKQAIAVGIGLFIALIGFVEAGLVVKNPGGILQRGDFSSPAVLLGIFGILIIAVLMARKIKGAILLGILATTVVGILTGIVKYCGTCSMPPAIDPTLFKFDLKGLMKVEYIVPTLTFLYMVMFDTIGTLIGVASQAGLMKNGRLPRVSRALFADAAATTVGAVCGTSTVTAYIESVTGVKAGGRTGLTAIVIAILFLCSMFFFPLVQMVGGGVTLQDGTILQPITSPALIIVGALMMWGVKNIAWDDYTEAVPAFLTMLSIPLTFSIADGIAIGFISYPIIKALSGQAKNISWLVYVLAIIFILRYMFL